MDALRNLRLLGENCVLPLGINWGKGMSLLVHAPHWEDGWTLTVVQLMLALVEGLVPLRTPWHE